MFICSLTWNWKGQICGIWTPGYGSWFRVLIIRWDYSHQGISVTNLKKKKSSLYSKCHCKGKNWWWHQSKMWLWISSAWKWNMVFFLIYFTLLKRRVSESTLLMPDWCIIADSVGCLKNILLHGGSESQLQFGNCVFPSRAWLDAPQQQTGYKWKTAQPS